jgi:hypothetical protein
VRDGLDETLGLRLVAALYANKFHKYNVPKHSIEGALHVLHRSRLSDSVKSKFPSAAQVRSTLRNARFLLHYWTDPMTPLSTNLQDYGFTMIDNIVVWDDSI